MIPSIISFAIGMFLLSQASSAFIFLLSAAFIGLGWGTIFPTAQTVAVQIAPSNKRGLATATYLSTMDSGLAIGSVIVGILVHKLDISPYIFTVPFLCLQD